MKKIWLWCDAENFYIRIIHKIDRSFYNYNSEHYYRNKAAVVKILQWCARHLWTEEQTYADQLDSYSTTEGVLSARTDGCIPVEHIGCSLWNDGHEFYQSSKNFQLDLNPNDKIWIKMNSNIISLNLIILTNIAIQRSSSCSCAFGAPTLQL